MISHHDYHNLISSSSEDKGQQVIIRLVDGNHSDRNCQGNLLLKSKLQTELKLKRKYIQDLQQCKEPSLFLSQCPIIDWGDLEYLLKIVEIYHQAFDQFPSHLTTDRKFILKCLKVNGKIIKKIFPLPGFNDEHDYSFFKEAIQLESVMKVLDRDFIKFLPYKPMQYLIWNREFFMRAVSVNPKIFACACRKLREDNELMFEAVKYNRQHFALANQSQQHDRELIFRACETKESLWLPWKSYKSSVLEMCLPAAKKDPELALEVLKRDPSSAQCAIRHFKNHKHIILKAIEIEPNLIWQLKKQYKWFPNFEELCVRAVEKQSFVYDYLGRFRKRKEIFIAGFPHCNKTNEIVITDEMLQDKDIAMVLVKTNSTYMELIAEHLRQDRDVLLQLAGHIHTQKVRDQYMPNFANDREFLLKAASISVSVFPMAREELRNDKELVMSGITKPYTCLETMPLVPEHLRLDSDILRCYVRNSGPHFDASLIPKSILQDSDFVWELIKINPKFITYFPDHELLHSNNKETIMKLISHGVRCYEFISQEFRNDPEIKLALIKLGNYK